jgi:ABC-type multidrug transport system fused ATPase/permease subunit
MGKPAGVQLKRWFIVMIVVLLLVSISSVLGAVLTRMTVLDVTEKYQPFQIATTQVEFEVVSAQRDMFEYISELSDTPDSALGHIDKLNEQISRAEALAPTADSKASLETLRTLAAQYRVAIEQLPSVMEGNRDWSRMEEMKSTAISYGDQAASLAAELSTWAQQKIQEKAAFSTFLTTAAMWGLIGLFIASMVVIAALVHWWKRFQDMMLGI